MAAAAIYPLLSTLSTLIQNEVGLLWRVNKDMEKLRSTLSTILAVLDDAEMKQHREKAIQNWLRKLKDAAHKISDILDECQAKATRREIKGQNLASTKKKVWTSVITRYTSVDLFFRHKIGNRMKDIIEEINAIAEERTNFHLNVGLVNNGLQDADSRETGSHLLEPEVFGREDDNERILNVLTKDVCDFEDLSVYPIIGMGGLGKTTLAQMIFNDGRIHSHFPLKIWVYVSQDFDVKRVMKQTIQSISGNIPEASSIDSLQKRLRELLSGERYLLILDDLWSEDQHDWDKLKRVLACGLPGSCVLVTTRSEKVAAITRKLPIHRLTYLSEEICWLLFRQRAFGPDNQERPELVAIGKEIVKKCGGVPLAAKALGGLLRFREDEKEWLNVKESELWDIPLGECSILPALRLSYFSLPLELRHCFSYCAVFPKGLQIEKDKLIHHWMANGLITQAGKLQVEDVGNRICNELYMRSFFHNKEKDWRSGNVCYKMHDLIHDLAQSVNEGECQIINAERASSVEKLTIRHVTLVDNCRHGGVFPEALNRNSSLHTILLQHRDAFCRNENFVNEFSCDFKNFNYLRLFDANGARMMQLSESVGNSKHLRYLNLSGTLITELPASICGLHNLQTLNLNGCQNLQRLPKKTNYLRGLRHLCLQGCYIIEDMPPEVGKLTQLKTLSLFAVGESSDQRLGELQHLDLGGELLIKNLERVRNSIEAKEADLAGKRDLRVLRLYWGYRPKLPSKEFIVELEVIEALKPHPNIEKLTIDNYGGKEFPVWMWNTSTLRNVVSIKLQFCTDCSNCLGLPALGQLPQLKRLHIDGMDKLEYIIQDGNNFPSLEILKIRLLTNLKGLSLTEGGEEEGLRQIQPFPRLRKMVIDCCPKLVFSTLPALEYLKIHDSSSETLTSISKLTSLTKLSLDHNEDIVCLPDEMLQNLTRLLILRIDGFTKLNKLPENMSSLVSLKSLKFQYCDELEFLPVEGIGRPKSVFRMKIHECPKIVSLPRNFQTVTKLDFLESDFSPELKRKCDYEEDWAYYSFS